MALIEQMVSSGIQSHRAQAISGFVAAGLVGAGTELADALALPAAINVFSTAAAGSGARLPRAEAGDTITVRNGGANALLVYPAVAAGVINALSPGAGFSMAAGKNAQFVCTSTTAQTWAVVLSA
jgi:hypothetical protein